MNFLQAIANTFRSAPKTEKVDRYNLLSPLLATGEFVASTKDALAVIKTSAYAEVVTGKSKPGSAHAEKSVKAYQDYVKHLGSFEREMERVGPLNTVVLTLEAISQNLVVIEDNFQALFGSIGADHPEQNIKSSSLLVIGYLEKADNYCTWLSNLIEHLTADAGDMIPPFRGREMLSKAAAMSEFAQLNLNKWNPKRGGLFSEIKAMQTKGADLPIQMTGGQWIDEYAHDSQFSHDEQNLITASFSNPIMGYIVWKQVRTQARIELATAKKEWLVAKLIQIQSKLRGEDPASPEYKRMKTITDKYASLVSKYEQQIERMRG